MGFSTWMTVPCGTGPTGASPLPALGTCGGVRNLGTNNLCDNTRVLLCVPVSLAVTTAAASARHAACELEFRLNVGIAGLLVV